MPLLKAIIAYDGSAFCGFALQKDRPSVLGRLKEGLLRVGIDSEIIGAGRTDKGVHATGQVIAFDVREELLGSESGLGLRLDSGLYSEIAPRLHTLRELLNAKLYPHIYIKSLRLVPSDFHPRFLATSRTYRYLLSQSRPTPFAAPYVSYEKIGDLEAFRRALGLFEGRHNMGLFKKVGSFSRSDVREIYEARCYARGELVVIKVRGSGFLRAQVRLMVGAALSVSHNRLSLGMLKEQLEGQKRHYHYPLSPNGLYLCHVGYGEKRA